MTAGRLTFAALLAVTLAVYLTIVLWSLALISAEAGGLAPFDLRPGGYDFSEAQAFLTSLSPVGRTQYLGPQAWLDLVYPALLALTLGFAIWHLLRGARSSLRWAAMLLPALGMVFDYLENARVRGLLLAEAGTVSREMVAAASFATVIKSAATTAAMVLLIVVLAVRSVVWWRGRGGAGA